MEKVWISDATAQPTTTRHPQKAKGNIPTGYECELIEPPPDILATECSICLHIPRASFSGGGGGGGGGGIRPPLAQSRPT